MVGHIRCVMPDDTNKLLLKACEHALSAEQHVCRTELTVCQVEQQSESNVRNQSTGG